MGVIRCRSSPVQNADLQYDEIYGTWILAIIRNDLDQARCILSDESTANRQYHLINDYLPKYDYVHTRSAFGSTIAVLCICLCWVVW